MHTLTKHLLAGFLFSSSIVLVKAHPGSFQIDDWRTSQFDGREILPRGKILNETYDWECSTPDVNLRQFQCQCWPKCCGSTCSNSDPACAGGVFEPSDCGGSKCEKCPFPKSNALSLALRSKVEDGYPKFEWQFRATKPTSPADFCNGEPVAKKEDEDIEGDDPIDQPPWPTFKDDWKFKIDDVECSYVNKGDGAGLFKCPDIKVDIKCVGDKKKEKTGKDGVENCSEDGEDSFHRIANCEW